MDLQQLSFFPLKHISLYEFWKLQTASFWVTSEINFSSDKKDFDRLDAGTQGCIKDILCFFAGSDGLVQQNLAENFMADFGLLIKDCIPFYSIQSTIEIIHNETYSTMIDVLITDINEKNQCFNAMATHKTVSKIGTVMYKWMQRLEERSNKRDLQRLIAFICVEAILFTGSFVFIFWLKTKNVMTGLTSSNELISRDETLHAKFGIALYHLLTTEYGYERLSKSEIREIIEEFMEVASLFVIEALNPERCRGSDMSISSEGIIEYLKVCADNVLDELGYDKIYNAENPFSFMILSSMHQKTNFFERKVTQYKKQGVSDISFSQQVYV